MTKLGVEHRGLGDAKAHFAECVREVERGRTVVLTRHGRPVARLVPLAALEERTQRLPDRDPQHAAGEIRERMADYETQATPVVSDAQARMEALRRLLEEEIWPQIPPEMIGRSPTKMEREEILGFSEDGT